MLDTLLEIGDIKTCIHALSKCKNGIDDAYTYILDHQCSDSDSSGLTIFDHRDVIDIMSLHNNIAFITKIFLEELPRVCQRCLLCHEQLEYNCIRPTICNGKLCQMQFSTMGIGFSLENEITNN